ncbi:MAG: hypothetical protein FJ106_09235 [Deltaproteobacteria bacterium]|nr:hypothetical protein [Deltaproteobacteria bacterium]
MGNWKLWIEKLAERISRDIFNSGDDPLDSDEAERIGRLLALELDFRQGNLNSEQYEENLLRIERR